MPAKELRKNENGQAMVEFVVVFPVVFLLCLVIMQTFLLLTARQVVNYAAYCATRSAIVIFPESGSTIAKEKAKRAAAIACWSISPKKGFGATEKFIKPVEDIVEGATGINFDLGRRFNMANSNVSVKLTPAKLNTKTPHQDVTV